MHSPDQPSSVDSRRFVLIFAGILFLLILGFWGMVRWATTTLPQENEVITLDEAAQGIEAEAYERILIQEERDIFFYEPGESRPLYLQLELTEIFTDVMQTEGINPAQFPPLTVETE